MSTGCDEERQRLRGRVTSGSARLLSIPSEKTRPTVLKVSPARGVTEQNDDEDVLTLVPAVGWGGSRVGGRNVALPRERNLLMGYRRGIRSLRCARSQDGGTRPTLSVVPGFALGRDAQLDQDEAGAARACHRLWGGRGKRPRCPRGEERCAWRERLGSELCGAADEQAVVEARPPMGASLSCSRLPALAWAAFSWRLTESGRFPRRTMR